MIMGIDSQMIAMGEFCAHFKVDEDDYDVKCHIVSDNIMTPDVIIGMNLLEHAEVFISSDAVTTRKLKHNSAQNNGFFQECSRFANCSYINESEQEFPDLSHVMDKNIANEFRNEIQNYKPNKTCHSPMELKIILTDEVPVYQPPRRLPKVEKDRVDKIVDEWLKNGIVRASNSDYASPILLKKKKDGSDRLCVDYRRLNKKMYKERYLLPIIDDQVDMLQEGKFLLRLTYEMVFSIFQLKGPAENIRRL